MKKYILFALLLLSFISTSLQAQSKTPLSPEVLAFWKKFQRAVVQNNPAAVAAMTRFPFLYPNETDAAAFLKSYPLIFDSSTRACFAKAKPVPDEGFFNVFCGGNTFMFGRDQGEYKFFSIESRD
jgi:hypothetical protein